MQYAHQIIVDRWSADGFPAIPMGIGIATGELTVGEFGSDLRSDYTVIGAAANLGSHICGGAAPGEVLISTETYEQVADHVEVERVTGRRFKNVSTDVVIYRVTGAS
jgi:class 3 adenylate cyclase